jgi:hypothetical protein
MGRTALLLVVAGVLVGAPAARAGGDFADLAVGGARVWFVGAGGVRSLDARTGRTLSRPQLVGLAYPLSVALTGGVAWIASVENGYVWGTLSRIDLRTGKVRVVWRRRESSVQYVAAGAGSVWTLIGSRKGMRIARFTLSGRLLGVWRVAGAGRIAADQQGCWISTDHWLVQIDPRGQVHRVVRARFGDVSTGAGAVWLVQARSVLRIDERTHEIRRLATGPLGGGGFQHDLAADGRGIWALREANRTRSTLVRYDSRTGRRTGRATLPGIADAMVVTPNAVWVATIAPHWETVLRFDPRTLRRTLRVRIL